ncbi:MAG: hypothetical protein HY222_04135 [Thaumarchaeota archaeon]|nr:hypothetical protein [Nitrososphaerota archaeon]MBI3641565.1 hypothetical protein [Nitrososphaerota archaeon]
MNAPVGYVEQTISEIIKKSTYLKVVEQNSISGTKYVRKVVIGYNQFPIVSAITKFDSQNLPESVMSGLLQRKESIGKILRKNNIIAQRGSVIVNYDLEQKKITRDYEILYKNSIWFQVSEDIRLDFLNACQYC